MALQLRFLGQILLWVLAAALLVILFSCASGTGEGGGRTSDSSHAVPYTAARPMRLVLARSEARDSAALVTEFFVDQALRAALDSIPAARYLTINYRDSLANSYVANGKTGIPLAELGRRLNLDGAILTRVARFGGVLAVELRIVEPSSGRLIYRDLSFSLIRYRDTSGTMFLGPTLFDAVRKSLGKYFGVEHRPDLPVATEPLVISNIAIPNDSLLGQVRLYRQTHSTKGVKALGELARLNFPELVAFDYESRNQLLRLVGVGAVNDYSAVEDLEREALYNVGVDRYVAGSVTRVGDSIHLGLKIMYVKSRTADSVIDHQDTVVARTRFESTKSEEDFVIAFIDIAEPLFKREADRVQRAYEQEHRRGGAKP
ncbi:MAG: hypothetical protein JST22_03530 [Bacteroidetes bacterium]|nr:hypothetical protein [Bacteroidota bacterium]